MAACLPQGDGLSRFLNPAVKPETLRAWIFTLRDAERRTIKRKTSSARTFFRFLNQRGWRDDNPASDLGVRLSGRTLPRNCAESTVEKMYQRAAAESDSFVKSRDFCILDLLYGCGLRRSEAAGLKLEDLDLQRRAFTVLGKRNKQRLAPFAEIIGQRLETYLKLRAERAEDGVQALLITDRGKAIYDHLIYRRVAFLSSGLGDAPSTHPHALRHSYASQMIDAGADLNSVKELLGHESALTTQIYVHNSFERLRKLYQNAHPRSQATKTPSSDSSPIP